jgi:tetratricopeptide (TPR) repeat protein
MKALFLLVLLFFSVNIYAQSEFRPKNDTALALFIDGKSMEIRNDLTGAINNFREALKFENSPGIHFALSQVYYRLEKYKQSLSEVNKSLISEPGNTIYLEHLANLQITLGDFQKAASTYESIMRNDSGYVYGLYTLARLYQEMKQPEKAIGIFERLTDKVGYDEDILRKMYEIYFKNKEIDKAAGVLEEYLTLDPYNQNLRLQLAALYVKQNKLADAQRIYEELLAINPDDKDIQNEAVKVYFRVNAIDKAFERYGKLIGKDSLTYLEKVSIGEIYYKLISQDRTSYDIVKNIFSYLNEQYPDEWMPYYYLGGLDIIDKKDTYKSRFVNAIQLADTSRDAYIQIGFTYFQKGDIPEAKSVLSKGLEKFPSNSQLNYFYGLVLQRTGQQQEAISYFEKGLQLSPADINILSTLGLAYNSQKMYDKSVSAYERALAVDPGNASVLNNYAYNLSERNQNINKALSMAKTAVEKDPNNPSYLDTIGWIYYRLGDYKNAVKYIEKSLSFNPNNAVVLEHLGDVYRSMGNNDKAISSWNRSLNINPANEELKNKLKEIK